MSQPGLNQLVNALQKPAFFEHYVSRFEVIETHISCVLLTGNYAYKFKKPVNFGFVDFSTLEKRHHYCEEELRLNSRFAPDMYLEVVRITGTMQKPKINGRGTIIEYAVKMRQFPQQALLSNKAINRTLTQTDVDQLAICIARFHVAIKKSNQSIKFGSANAVLMPVMANFQQMNQYASPGAKQELKQLKVWSEQEHQRLFNYFDNRKKAGFIRACHGDLHLGNIVLLNQLPTPFDGIEFNESLYWIDIINEIAFLIMDLEVHQYRNFAFRFLNAWLELTGDYQGLSGLRFYQVYRAMVRAKVGSIRLTQSELGSQNAHSQQEIEDYLHLARSYTREPKPQLLICYGLSGSGKTTISQILLESMPAIRIRSDVERKRLHGLTSGEKSNSGFNKNLYSTESSLLTYQHLNYLAGKIIDYGYSVIVDATFLKYWQRQLFQSLATEKEIPFHIIHCHAQLQTMRKRILTREQSTQDASEADLYILDQQIKNQQILTSEEKEYCINIDTESAAAKEQFGFIMQQ